MLSQPRLGLFLVCLVVTSWLCTAPLFAQSEIRLPLLINQRLPCIDIVPACQLTTQPSPLALSPDGSKLAFIYSKSMASTRDDSDLGIYVMSPNGSQLTKLFDIGSNESIDELAWSPDGRKIAFTSRQGQSGQNQDIFLVDIDSRHRTNLTDSPEYEINPVWSPDGNKILYWLFDGAALGHHLYVMNADGSNPKKLADNTDYEISPSWSPDSNKIVFAGASIADIYIINVDGSNLVNLTQNLSLENTYVGSRDNRPIWSLDGSKINFLRDSGENVMIAQINADGSNAIRLSTFPIRPVTGVSWSPDRSKVLYQRIDYSVRIANPPWALDLMNVDGSHLAQLAYHHRPGGLRFSSKPVWSPDNDKVFYSIYDGPAQGIYVVGVDE